MNYEEFKKKSAEEILNYLPEEYSDNEVCVNKINKVNASLDALNIFRPDKNASPNIYLNDVFKKYEERGDFEEAMQYAADFFLDACEQLENFCFEEKIDIQEENIVFQLVNTEANIELLQSIPHRDFLDMTVIYRIVLNSINGGFNSIIITDSLAEQYGWDEEKLYRQAMENTDKLLTCEVYPVPNAFDIISNKAKFYGASAVLYSHILEEAAEKAGDNLYLIPSSVHEMLAVPAGMHSPDVLVKMLKDCNGTVVEAEEILSNTVYYYERKTGQLSIARTKEMPGISADKLS